MSNSLSCDNLWNIPLIFSTFSVLNLDTSNCVIELQNLNIFDISLTKFVLKLETSNSFNNPQPENIFDILITFFVSNLEISKLVKELQSVKA